MKTFRLISPEVRDNCVLFIRSLNIDPEKPQVVNVAEESPDKTREQRNKFHALCRQIGREVGLTEGQVKAAIKQEFFGIDEVKIGNKWYRVVRSSEDAGKLEYSELIDFAYQWAADGGVYIGD